MFKCNQPLATNLTIAISNEYRQINRTTLHINTPDMLEAVTESDIAIHGDAEISDREFWRSFVVGEKVHPITAIGISAIIFLPRHYIENDETIVWYVILHNRINITGSDGRCKIVLKYSDRCFII